MVKVYWDGKGARQEVKFPSGKFVQFYRKQSVNLGKEEAEFVLALPNFRKEGD